MMRLTVLHRWTLSAGLLLLTLCGHAQGLDDIMRYGRMDPLGTARSTGLGGASPLMGKVSGLGMPPPSEIMPGMPTSGCSARIGDGFRLRLDLPGWGRARRRLLIRRRVVVFPRKCWAWHCSCGIGYAVPKPVYIWGTFC